MDLHNNQLTSLPPELGNLSSLEDLYLHHNQLTNLPPELGNLSKLGWLDLHHNQLTSLPLELHNLSNLGWLDLHHNQLTSLPPELDNLSSLWYLDLHHNQLTSLPPELGNLSLLSELYLHHNQLTSLPPELGNLSSLDSLFLGNNNLTFEALEPVVQKFPFAVYSPQAHIPLHQNGDALYVSAGGTLSNNTYQWFRAGETNSTIKGDSVFHPSQSGRYFAKITNAVCTQLTLHSDAIRFKAPAEFAASASAANSLQQYDKPGLFLVYPNPAKNALHIQGRGNNSFSLMSQSGEILLVCKINATGTIDVSGLVTGLYYLRNNATGVLRKVIIAK